MKNPPKFSKNIEEDLNEHSSQIPKRIVPVEEPTKEERKAGRPKKPKSERRKQIILTIGPESFDELSKIPDFKRRLGHLIDDDLNDLTRKLSEYIIK